MGVLDTLSGLSWEVVWGVDLSSKLTWVRWKTKIYKGVPSQKWAALAAVIYHFVEGPKQDYNRTASQVTPSRPWGVPDYMEVKE